ncbi:subtilisin-like serine protease, partial [Podila verticillata]
EGHTVRSFESKLETIRLSLNEHPGGAKILDEYMDIRGFHAILSPAMYDTIKSAPEIDYIEEDSVSQIAMEQQDNPPWGLCRISERDLDLTQPYIYPQEAGFDVAVYVIDTGVYTQHVELRGRVELGPNFVPGSPNGDENGHGTHVCAIVGGTTYGVAKRVHIIHVKALDHNGCGSKTQTIASLRWVISHAQQQRQQYGKRSVVNMSFIGEYSRTVNDYVDRLYAANVPVFVAAGNFPWWSADRLSPSSAQWAYVVAATDRNDRPFIDNSSGRCIRIYAPGVDVTSAWLADPAATRNVSGTSMAAPHVAGVAAVILSIYPDMTVDQLFNFLTMTGAGHRIIGLPDGAPNLLVNI